MKQVVIVKPGDRYNLVESQHRELDDRLRALGRRAYLTPAERVEVAEIKKRKLVAKDEMVSLRRMMS